MDDSCYSCLDNDILYPRRNSINSRVDTPQAPTNGSDVVSAREGFAFDTRVMDAE